MKKAIIITAIVLIVAGVAYYIWKQNKAKNAAPAVKPAGSTAAPATTGTTGGTRQTAN